MTYQLILLKLQFQLCVEKVRCLTPKCGLYEGVIVSNPTETFTNIKTDNKTLFTSLLV